MSRTTITVYIRSKQPEEIDIDVYGYKYDKIDGVVATVENKTYTLPLGRDINGNADISVVLRFVFANTSDDRINRISHIRYLGTIYHVERVENFPPRIKVTLGQVFKGVENDLLSEVQS